MHRQRIYVDTSVIGGCRDPEFAEESLALLETARFGRVVLLLSDLLFQELEDAPAAVVQIVAALRYDNPDDEKAIELLRLLSDEGLPHVLQSVCSLSPSAPLHTMISEKYRLSLHSRGK